MYGNYSLELMAFGRICFIHRTKRWRSQCFHPNEPWETLNWKLNRMPKYIRPEIIKVLVAEWIQY